MRRVTPQQMRRFAVIVFLIAMCAAVLAVGDLVTDFGGGQVFAITAIVAALSGLGLATEMWYVSRRIERPRAKEDADLF